MKLSHIQRTRAVVDAVVSDVDLVAIILAGNVGPSSFVAASLVCKSWLQACRDDGRVLRGAALYQSGLTKCSFMKLFAISSHEADLLPRSSHTRFGGGTYFLYRSDAVDAVLAAGGFKGWHRRLKLRGARPSTTLWQKQLDCFRRNFSLEERIHRTEASRRRALCLVATTGG
jgi:hypothetical protein